MSKPASQSRIVVRGVTTAAPPRDRLRPWLLLAVTAVYVARPLLTSESAAETGDGMPLVMLLSALAGVWTARAALSPRATVRADWSDLALGVFLLAHTASAAWAVRSAAPRPALNMMWEWIGLVVGYFLLRQLVASPREVRALVAVMIGLSAAISCYGLEQYFVSLPADRERYAIDPEGALRDAHVFAPPGSRQRVLFEQRINSTEPMATFALANSLAGFLAPWLVVALGVGLSLRGQFRDHALSAVGLAAAGALMAACLMLTKSRAAFLATGIGALALVALATWRLSARATLLAAAALAAVAAALGGVAVVVGALDRQVITEAGKSLSYRWQYWQASWQMIQDYPWLGCGPGNFQGTYTRYKLPEASEVVADPHNFLVEVWSTAGAAAMLAFVAFLGLVGWRLLRPRQTSIRSARTNADQESDAPAAERFVLAGGAAGFILAIALGPLTTVPLSLAAGAGGLAVATVVVVLVCAWMERGELPVFVPAIGAAVLLLNLLAAGGIGFPGVSGTLWLLLALALAPQGGDHVLRRWAAYGAVATAAALIAGCYLIAYRPVLRCAEALRRAETESKPMRVELHLAEAADADAYSAEPWRKLAALEWESWQHEPSSATLERFKSASDQALRLAPRHGGGWQLRGDVLIEAYRKTHNPDNLREAISAYQRAVDLYPNQAAGRAQLAIALAEAGEATTAATQAAEALRLDEITPHSDQKLPDELRGRLLRIQSAKSGGP